MKERLLTNWDAMRWMRLVFAIVFLFAGITRHEPIAYAAAAFFGLQALLNIGCCGTACAPQRKNAAPTTDRATTEISYEEVE